MSQNSGSWFDHFVFVENTLKFNKLVFGWQHLDLDLDLDLKSVDLKYLDLKSFDFKIPCLGLFKQRRI